MILFQCRTPFIIECDADVSQIATKIELFIWRLNESEPATPTKVIEKSVFSPTQYVNRYNISPFVADMIDSFDVDRCVYNVKIVKYYKLTDTWILDETLRYVSSYGYQGTIIVVNPTILYWGIDFRYTLPLDTIGFDFVYPSLDILFDFDIYSDFRVQYISALGTEEVDFTGSGIKLLRVPITSSNEFFINGNDVKLYYSNDGITYTLFSFIRGFYPECEPKYKPYILEYINIAGGLSKITFFKKSSIADEFKGSDYNLQGSKQQFNLNGTQTIKLNTGWVNESMTYLIKQMMLSEKKHLISNDSVFDKLVTCKTTSMQEKTHLNDRLINYEIEFEVATPIIQNYV